MPRTTAGTRLLAGGITFDGVQNYLNLGNLGILGSSLGTGAYISTTVIVNTAVSGFIAGGGLSGSTTAFLLGINQIQGGAVTRDGLRVFLRDNSGKVVDGGCVISGLTNGSSHTIIVTVIPSTNTITVTADGVAQTITYSTQATPSSFSSFANGYSVGARNNNGTLQNFVGSSILNFSIGTSSSALFGKYNLTEATGTIANDSSGNNNTATLSGTPPPTWITRTTSGTRTAVSITRLPADDILYLPTGWDTTWKAAKAASGASTANMAFIGDSITQGAKTTDSTTKPWTELVRTNLLLSKTLGGDYYPTHNSTAFESTFTGTPPFVWNYTTSLVFNKHGWERMPGFSGTTPVTTLTFTTPQACTQIDFFYVDFASGTFDYKVDGGSATTITTTKTGVGTDAQIKKVSITGLANTTHTVVFGNQSTTNVMLIMGCAAYKSTSTGLGFVRNAAAGAEANDFVGSTTWATEDRITFWSGVNPQSLPYGSTYTFGFPMQPHLAFISYGVNDCTNLRTPASFKRINERFIQALRLGQSNCSIVFVINCMPDTSVSDVTSGVTNGKYWNNYITVMRELAVQYSCAFVNINSKWGLTPFGQGFMNNNDVHPKDDGHADIANLINSII